MTLPSSDPLTAPDTLADLFPQMASSLGPGLVGAAAIESLTRLCRRLPIELSNFFGFETHLGHNRTEVDFLIEVKRGTPGHALLAGNDASVLDALCDSTAAWRAVRDFARVWAAADDPAREAVRNIWLEFDLIAARAAGFDPIERPSVFWGPDTSTDRDGGLVDVLRIIQESFAPFPSAIPLDALGEAVERLPAGARVFQLGAMQQRHDVLLRACVNGIAAEATPQWLTALGWSGDAEALGRALESLQPLVRTFAVDVDFTSSGIGPKIGIECYREWQNGDPSQWVPLLEDVTARRLCCKGKRRALLTYPARTDFTFTEQAAARRRGFLYPVLYRNIHHVKLAFVAGGFTEAKGYLGVSRPGVNIARFVRGDEASGLADDGWYAP